MKKIREGIFGVLTVTFIVLLGYVPKSDLPTEYKEPIDWWWCGRVAVKAANEDMMNKIMAYRNIPETTMIGVEPSETEWGYEEETYEEPYEETWEENREEAMHGEQGMTYLGVFDVTAYEWTGNPCANGCYPTEGYTVACNSLPLGTTVYIDGVGYRVVEDRGATWHSDMWMDLYLGDVAECYEWGVRNLDVYVVD